MRCNKLCQAARMVDHLKISKEKIGLFQTTTLESKRPEKVSGKTN